MAKSYARIDVLTAPEANMGVVIRRGPRNKTQILTWDFATDTITPGQWIDARIFTRRCDVSPDGKYLALFIKGTFDTSNHKAMKPISLDENSIVLCRPPYISPLGLWTGFGNHCAGVWADNQTFHAHWCDYYTRRVIESPSAVKIVKKKHLTSPDEQIHHLKLIARGWQCPTWSKMATHKNPNFGAVLKSLLFNGSFLDNKIYHLLGEKYIKAFPHGEIQYSRKLSRESAQVLNSNGKVRLKLESKEHPIWIDVDQNERLVYAHLGCLWAWTDFPKGKPQLVADLNGNTFEEVARRTGH